MRILSCPSIAWGSWEERRKGKEKKEGEVEGPRKRPPGTSPTLIFCCGSAEFESHVLTAASRREEGKEGGEGGEKCRARPADGNSIFHW